MLRRVLVVAAALGVAGAGLPAQQSSLPVLVVDGGERPRRQAWVDLTLPSSVRGDDLQLRGEDGLVVPVQVGPDRRAWAVLPAVAANTRASYTFEPALRPTAPPVVTMEDAGAHRRLSRNGQLMLRYVTDPLPLPDGVDERYRRGGYLHPVQSPAGVVATEDFPPNHVHHHGIWTAWTSTHYDGRTPDFWNMGDGTGRVEFEGLGDEWSGPLTGGFTARHRYVDLTRDVPTTVLTEHWTVTGYAMDLASQPAHVFDLVVAQRTAGPSPLELPTYRYGGVGVRGRHLWDGPDRTVFRTADGRGRLDGHGTRATWAYMGGEVEGRRVGIAVLSHPANAASPQPMRIHPTEPFFNFAPQQAGPLAIRPGETFVLRYRFVVMDDEPDARAIDDLWQDWATPVQVRVR